MRVLGLALAGVFALIGSTAANADQPGPKTKPARPPSGTPQGTGSGLGSPTLPGGGDWRANPRYSGQWEEHWAPSHWVPNHFFGYWGTPEAWGGPYIGWGVPYVPYRYYRDWGALWYPYAEWRGPHGGWGNP